MRPLSPLLVQTASIATAPFCEQRVAEHVMAFVKARRHLRAEVDAAGNILIEQNARVSASKGATRWVFAAHMDHPGLRVARVLGPDRLEADFFGSVAGSALKKAAVRFFDGDKEITGKVTSITRLNRRKMPTRVRVRMDGAVGVGALGMFDLPAGKIRGNRFECRVCDNLAGVAAGLQMLDQLGPSRLQAPVALLLTRAEEVGFVGAMAAMRLGTLKPDDHVVVLECSSESTATRRGAGVVVRVGDRSSVFDPQLSAFFTRQAAKLAKRDKTFAFQRALMSGGSCEATAYAAAGLQAGCICVPLGNYHNMTADKRAIASEQIDVRDWKNWVKLLVAIARHGGEIAQRPDSLQADLARLYKRYERRLYATSSRKGLSIIPVANLGKK